MCAAHRMSHSLLLEDTMVCGDSSHSKAAFQVGGPWALLQ